MAHAAVTSADAHFSAERFARGGIGQAGVAATRTRFDAWLDAWSMRTPESGYDVAALAPVVLSASSADFSYQLALDAEIPLVRQGDDGFSVKSEAGQASHYLSQPFYTASGRMEIGGEALSATGRAWLDREWSSSPLTPTQTGWDWLSLHIDEGSNAGGKAMIYGLRDSAGDDYVTGNWITPDGGNEEIPPGAITMTPTKISRVAGRDVPTHWRVEIPSLGVAIETTPLNEQAWMDASFAYWEGPVRFSGSHAGDGYLEMTGY